MSFQKEIRALQSQIDLNTNELSKLYYQLTNMITHNKTADKHHVKFNQSFIDSRKHKVKQLAENQRVLKYIISEYIRMNRVFKE